MARIKYWDEVSQSWKYADSAGGTIPPGENQIYIGVKEPNPDSTAVLWVDTSGSITPPVPVPPSGVVTNGLILHLDGKGQGDTPGKWTDKISGLAFTLNNCTALANGVRFDKADSYAFLENADHTHKFADRGTIEVVFTTTASSGNSYILFSSNGVHELTLGKQNEKLSLSTTETNSYTLPTLSQGLHSISASLTSAFSDRNKLPTVLPGDNWRAVGNNVQISGRNTTEFLFKGIIHEIRIYNRKLKPEEVIANQKADFEKYGGGV